MQEQNDEVEWHEIHLSCLDAAIELTHSQLQWLPAHTCTIPGQPKVWHSWGGVFQAQLVKRS